MLLMGCDPCRYEREIADRLIPGIPIGCFPDLYAALAGNLPDQEALRHARPAENLDSDSD